MTIDPLTGGNGVAGDGEESANPEPALSAPKGNGFGPRRFVRQGHVQTLLARRRPPNSVTLRTEQPMLLDAGVDETGYDPENHVRLLGYYSPSLQPSKRRGLVQVIHGWHGSSHSADVLYISDALLQAGYAVFRLNMRDHGPGLHYDKLALNRGMFLGTLLNEVAVATRNVAQMAGDMPFAIVGGSLGGNFGLRLGVEHNRLPIPNLKRIIAICPAVRPESAAAAIDRSAGYRIFFRARFMQELREKQRLFPEIYDITGVERLRTIAAITDELVRRYSPWEDSQDYFAHYTVTPEMIASLAVQTTIIAARDDAVIPIEDFAHFAPTDSVDIQITETGGHMGFVDVFPYRRWLPGTILAELDGMLRL